MTLTDTFSTRRLWRVAGATLLALACALPLASSALAQVAGDPIDVGQDFLAPEQTFFMANRVAQFDANTGRGTLQWDRYVRQPGLNFNKVDRGFTRGNATEFPGSEYDRDPVLPFRIDFVSARSLRIRMSTRNMPFDADSASIMLAGPVPTSSAWRAETRDSTITWTSDYGRVRLVKNPWSLELYDSSGRLLTRTQRLGQPNSFTPYVPFSFVRRARDLGRSTAAVFELAPDEKIFGMGESFTRLDKRGQRIVAYLRDAMGAQSKLQYKAVPFFLSSRGYGMFVHTSAPVTFDVGAEFDSHHAIYSGDEQLDLFVFLGEPKDVVSEYTAITGRSPVPPLWSFGLWMSRITYKTEAEAREVARLMRQHRIPADVLHLDTGWFETDWRGDFQFSASRFPNPRGMLSDLRALGFRVSLWQYTYFTPKNTIWREVVDNGYHVRNEGGRLPAEDAVLDFSNPAAVRWYRGKLAELLRMGVSAIKADFGENAPATGIYHSGRSGWYEHNLYPVRYNQAVYDVTREANGAREGIIWARSAWAGSQRYPLHWGGDAENTNSAMAATLRSGLSMGLSGFSFWSHDIGGFVNRAPRDLYRRWTPFGALTSHTRTHGAPPREPWEYDEAFMADFRRAIELKYTLMPYILAQAKRSAALGHPMLRALFFDFPHDPTSWTIEDEYLFGTDLLVAPLFADSISRRRVYAPPGTWIDYQSGRTYEGARWHEIEAGQIPIVLLVRNHAAIAHAGLAQSTGSINWNQLELRVFSTDSTTSSGEVTSGDTGDVRTVRVANGRVVGDPFNGTVRWRVTRQPLAP